MLAQCAPLIITPTTSLASSISGRTPRHFWQLGETSGTTASDSGSSADNGTYQTGVTLNQQGMPGSTLRSIYLNGSGWVSTASGVSLGVPLAFTLLFRTNGAGGLMSFASASTDTGNTISGMYVGTDGQLYGTFLTSSSTHVVLTSSLAAVNDGEWHQAALLFNSSINMTLVQDGATAASNTNTAANTNTGYWQIGQFPNCNAWTNGGSDRITGQIAAPVFYYLGTIPTVANLASDWHAARYGS